MAIDVERLRFAEPLPDGTVAFLDDASLPAPRLATEPDSAVIPGDPIGDQPDAVRIVAMDGPRLLMRGGITDLPDERVDFEATGPLVDVGVDGVRLVDEDEGAIVIPLDDGLRLVAPDEYFMFGGGGPFIEPNALLGIAAAIGQRPLDEVDGLPGFYVFDGTIGGEAVGPGFFTDRTVTVVHSSREEALGGITATLHRLPEPPTALDLVAMANALTRGAVELPAVGDVSFFAGQDTYVELVSPVDILVISAPGELTDVIDTIDFAPLDELD